MPNDSVMYQLIACSITGILFWLLISYTMRYTLKLLLMYKGWMFEGRSRKPSIKTKLWVVLVRLLSRWNKPGLYSFQGSLPRLTLPSVQDTMKRVK